MSTKTIRDFSHTDMERIAGTFHAWRSDSPTTPYEDVPGFCAAAKTEDISQHGWILTPGRYVGAEDAETEDEPYAIRLQRLRRDIRSGFDARSELQTRVDTVLANIETLDG